MTQDFMCEPWILEKTGETVLDHQLRTVERYDRIAERSDTFVMPVLQGFHPEEYLECIDLYGSRLRKRMWVGVGSVCKRNSKPAQVEAVLSAIHQARPDLKLHGFGVKITALEYGRVRTLLHSADSMAWSYHARKQGRDGNDWREAMAMVSRIEGWPPPTEHQPDLL